MIFREQKGNMKFFQINLHNSIIKQLRTTSTIEKLAKITKRLEKDSKEIILFGSASRGEQSAESDFDLFVLTNNPKEAREIIKRERKKLPVSAIVKTPNEWGETEIKELEFYLEVKKGIKLYEQTF